MAHMKAFYKRFLPFHIIHFRCKGSFKTLPLLSSPGYTGLHVFPIYKTDLGPLIARSDQIRSMVESVTNRIRSINRDQVESRVYVYGHHPLKVHGQNLYQNVFGIIPPINGVNQFLSKRTWC